MTRSFQRNVGAFSADNDSPFSWLSRNRIVKLEEAKETRPIHGCIISDVFSPSVSFASEQTGNALSRHLHSYGLRLLYSV